MVSTALDPQTLTDTDRIAVARRCVPAHKLLAYAAAEHREARTLAPEMMGFSDDAGWWEATSKGILRRIPADPDSDDAATLELQTRITWPQVAALLQPGLQQGLIDELRAATRRYCEVASNHVDCRKDPEGWEAHLTAYRAASNALDAAKQAIWDAATPTEAQDTLW